MKKSLAVLVMLAVLLSTVPAALGAHKAYKGEINSSESGKSSLGGVSTPASQAAPRVQSNKMVALTFDDGPDPRFTPHVLNILKRERVKATFFVVGSQAERHRDLVMTAWLEGNEIANHSYSHLDMKKADWTNTVSEISLTQDVLMSITGSRPKYFRPPRGEFDNQDLKAAKAMGYKIVMWTVGIENHAAPTPQAMVDRVCANIKNGSIILLHDGNLDRSQTVAALPLLISRLKAMGYSMVTVTDLINSGLRKDKGQDVIEDHIRFHSWQFDPLRYLKQ
jgi:peptidoglycan/xylan/chitin deacetylase (PgdA/CDA1 family)